MISNGDLCELTQFGEDLIEQDPHVGTACVVMFHAGETTQEYRYPTMFGNTKGSARLQRPPPSLTPSASVLRQDTVGLLMIRQDSRFRSGTPQRVLTTQVFRWQCSSTRASCAPRTSPSRK